MAVKRFVTGLIGGIFTLLIVSTPSAHAVFSPVFSGSLSTDGGGGLTGTLQYATDTSLSWIVSFDSGTNQWKYDYAFDSNDSTPKNLSHIEIELSSNFTAADFLSGSTTGGLLDTYGPGLHGASDTGIPGTFYGVRYVAPTSPASPDYGFTIVTTRAPVWGDFFARDGAGVYVYNLGFTNPDTDPANPPADGTAANHYFNHVLRPDGSSTPCAENPQQPQCPPPPPPPDVPEPTSMLLMGTGLIGALGFGYTRKKRLL